MGAGKTTVGKLLADTLHYQFLDLDDKISQRFRRTIPQIFEEFGEPAFRQMEAQTLREQVSTLNFNLVLAVGGGAFVQPDNAALLRQQGFTSVWLDAPVEELRRRCAPTQERPLARDANHFRQLYEARRAGYMAADLQVDTSGKTPEQVASEVAARLRPEMRKAE